MHSLSLSLSLSLYLSLSLSLSLSHTQAPTPHWAIGDNFAPVLRMPADPEPSIPESDSAVQQAVSSSSVPAL